MSMTDFFEEVHRETGSTSWAIPEQSKLVSADILSQYEQKANAEGSIGIIDRKTGIQVASSVKELISKNYAPFLKQGTIGFTSKEDIISHLEKSGYIQKTLPFYREYERLVKENKLK